MPGPGPHPRALTTFSNDCVSTSHFFAWGCSKDRDILLPTCIADRKCQRMNITLPPLLWPSTQSRQELRFIAPTPLRYSSSSEACVGFPRGLRPRCPVVTWLVNAPFISCLAVLPFFCLPCWCFLSLSPKQWNLCAKVCFWGVLKEDTVALSIYGHLIFRKPFHFSISAVLKCKIRKGIWS